MPTTLSILTNVFTGAEDRARAIGIWSGTTGLGVAVGPVAGGWLLAHYWWGSVFFVNVPIALCGMVAAIWIVPNSKDPATKPPDPVGGLLSIVGLGLLLWGIIEAPGRSWTSPVVMAAVGLAAVTLTAFVLWERHSSHPMLELSFFSSRRFSVAIGGMAMVIFALMGGLFLLTQYLQFSLGYSALQTGLRVAPIAAVLLVTAPLSMVVVRAVGTKPVVFTGMVLIAVGLGLLSRVTVHSTYLDVMPAFLLMGMGTGLAFAPCTDSVMGSLPLDRAGVGAATNSAALQIGGALGVGVLGSLLNTRYQDKMAPVLAHQAIPSAVRDVIMGSLGGALAVAGRVGGALGAAVDDGVEAGVRERHGPGRDRRILCRRRRSAGGAHPAPQPSAARPAEVVPSWKPGRRVTGRLLRSPTDRPSVEPVPASMRRSWRGVRLGAEDPVRGAATGRTTRPLPTSRRSAGCTGAPADTPSNRRLTTDSAPRACSRVCASVVRVVSRTFAGSHGSIESDIACRTSGVASETSVCSVSRRRIRSSAASGSTTQHSSTRSLEVP